MEKPQPQQDHETLRRLYEQFAIQLSKPELLRLYAGLAALLSASADAVGMPGPEIPAEIVRVHAMITKESDRGCALAAASYVESELGRLFRRHLCTDERGLRDLLMGTGPLANFSSRIELAFGLGLISASVRRELRLIKAIRNEFAHSAEEIAFSDPSIANRCSQLSMDIFGEELLPRPKYVRSIMGVLAALQVAMLESPCSRREDVDLSSPDRRKAAQAYLADMTSHFHGVSGEDETHTDAQRESPPPVGLDCGQSDSKPEVVSMSFQDIPFGDYLVELTFCEDHISVRDSQYPPTAVKLDGSGRLHRAGQPTYYLASGGDLADIEASGTPNPQRYHIRPGSYSVVDLIAVGERYPAVRQGLMGPDWAYGQSLRNHLETLQISGARYQSVQVPGRENLALWRLDHDEEDPGFLVDGWAGGSR